jgi:MFS family permease
LARLFCEIGFCAGAASLVVPIYIGEIAQDDVRGMLSSGFQLMVTIGNLFGYILGTFVDWQMLAAVCGVFPLIGFMLMVWIPRSPRYLLAKGQPVEASAALMWLRGAKSVEQIDAELKSVRIGSLSSNGHSRKFNSVLLMIYFTDGSV